MLIRLFYALSEGPAIQMVGIWPTPWDALDYANEKGAVVAGAKILKRDAEAA